MANENYRMYNKKVEFLKPLQKGHKCTICKLLLRAPLQTDCGHRFCLQCFYINCGSEVCPEDNIDLTWKTVHSDKFCENEIKALEVYCQNRQRCGWTGTYESLQVCVSFTRDALIEVKKPGMTANVFYSWIIMSWIIMVVIESQHRKWTVGPLGSTTRHHYAVYWLRTARSVF